MLRVIRPCFTGSELETFAIITLQNSLECQLNRSNPPGHPINTHLCDQNMHKQTISLHCKSFYTLNSAWPSDMGSRIRPTQPRSKKPPCGLPHSSQGLSLSVSGEIFVSPERSRFGYMSRHSNMRKQATATSYEKIVKGTQGQVNHAFIHETRCRKGDGSPSRHAVSGPPRYYFGLSSHENLNAYGAP